MLYRFSVENFKSFRDRSEISFIPTGTPHRHVADQASKLPVSRTAVIYGANASGKSNFIKAIDFAQEFILRNEYLLEVKNLAYKLQQGFTDQPSIFSFEIKTENELFQYGTAISFKKSMILEEWLYQLNENGETEIFSRTYNDEKEQYDIDFQYEGSTPNESRYVIYQEDLAINKTNLILTELAGKQLEKDSFKEKIDTVFEWFKKLIIIFPTSKYNLLGAVAKDQDSVNDLYKSYFKTFDIDIEDIHLKEVDVNHLSMPEDILRDIKSDLLKDKQDNEKKVMAMLHNIKQDYLVRLDDNGELNFSEVKFTHRNGEHTVELDKQDESDGTQRLFDLIPMIGYIIKEDRVVIVDEIDRSLHPLLVKKIFEFFLKNAEGRKSQLICSTHDVLLLDSSLLEKNEVWFIRKRKSCSSIYSLDKFNLPDPNINLVENYLLGRMGSIPLFDD